MLEPRLQLWQRILQMSEQLHQLSVDEDWLAMTKLESERFKKLEDFFSNPVSESDAEIVEAGIQKMLKSDELLKKNSIRQQLVMSDDIKKLSTGRKAIKAYGNFHK